MGLYNALDPDRLSAAAAITQRIDELSDLVRDYLELPPCTAKRLSTIEGVIQARAKRRHYLRPDLFVEPRWDMLLDLYVARLKGARVSVSSLCVAANIPPTTALRHIADLVENGEIDRTPDPADQRRAFLELSDAAFARINEWIDHCL
ncbi:winged helix DNA-binding protein [Sphingomonas paucimobilis]|nr:marR family protein [Exiguobacterium sp. S17]